MSLIEFATPCMHRFAQHAVCVGEATVTEREPQTGSTFARYGVTMPSKCAQCGRALTRTEHAWAAGLMLEAMPTERPVVVSLYFPGAD